MFGARIGNFQIVSQLGAGGMGDVFLAEHTTIGTRVAIKMLQPHISANKEVVQRFFNEAIAVSKIQHAGIGKIFDVGFHEHGRAYLVMEFLDGETLAARVRRLGRLPLAMVSDIGRQITSVLEAVHRAGITHRDLKPDNIFVIADSELASGERVKILDFGIAKLTGHSAGLTATAAGSMGTPAYMSPEQWKNSRDVDWRADAYSLGCLAFEMAAGRPPFIAETIGEACTKHLTEGAPRLTSFVAAPAPLDALIASLLAKDPDHRPTTMREIGNAFAALVGDLIVIPATITRGLAFQPGPYPPGIPTLPPNAVSNTTLGAAAASAQHPVASRRSRTLLAVLLIAIGALGGVLVVLLSGSRSSPDVPSTPIAASTPNDAALAPSPSPPSFSSPSPPPPSPPPPSPASPIDAGVAVAVPVDASAPPVQVKRPAVPRTGKLVIVTRPSSQVYEGPRRLGPTPLTIMLSAGPHVLVFRSPGRPTLPQTVQVIGGETVSLTVTLPEADREVGRDVDHGDQEGDRAPLPPPRSPLPPPPRSPLPPPPRSPLPPPRSCDEDSCALDDNRRACCARFRSSGDEEVP